MLAPMLQKIYFIVDKWFAIFGALPAKKKPKN